MKLSAQLSVTSNSGDIDQYFFSLIGVFGSGITSFKMDWSIIGSLLDFYWDDLIPHFSTSLVRDEVVTDQLIPFFKQNKNMRIELVLGPTHSTLWIPDKVTRLYRPILWNWQVSNKYVMLPCFGWGWLLRLATKIVVGVWGNMYPFSVTFKQRLMFYM